MKKTYKVLSNLKHDGTNYTKGSEVSMDEEVAKNLLNDGVIAGIKEEVEEEVVDEKTPQPAVNKVSRKGGKVEGKQTVSKGKRDKVVDEEKEK